MVRAVASVAFALLFVAGPVLTMTLGPDVAVIGVAALLYPTVVVGIAAVSWRRRQLGLTASRAAWLSVELLVCPAFVPNLVRRITMQRPLDVDGARIVLATAAADVRDDLRVRLATRAEELIEAASADPATQAGLRSYLAGLRSAR